MLPLGLDKFQNEYYSRVAIMRGFFLYQFQQFDEFFFSILLRTILHILRSQNHRSADFPKPVRKKKERNSTNCCELCFLQTEKNSSQQFDEFFSLFLRTILQILRAQKHRSADFPYIHKRNKKISSNCFKLYFLQKEPNSSQQFDEFFYFLFRTILQILRAQKHRSADFPDPGISVTGPSQGMKIRGGS